MWFKGHRKLRVILPAVVMLALALSLTLPTFAAVTYTDIRGTYNVTSGAVSAVYLDGSSHPRIPFGQLIITTVVNATRIISDATLTMQSNKNISLCGCFGTGTRPYISLEGTDSDGTYVTINGRVSTNSTGAPKTFTGSIQGYVLSEGVKGISGGNGTADYSTVAANSGAYSALLTEGDSAGVCYLDFGSWAGFWTGPMVKMNTGIKLSDLATLPQGKLSFYFNLQDTKTPGPFIGLRFTSADCTDPSGAGHVDVTVMPYQSLTGNGTWMKCDIIANSTRALYYGNTPDDGTSFSWEIFGGNYNLGQMPAYINGNPIMLEHGASASSWKLTGVCVDLYSGEARTCYVDDVKIGSTTYTLEPLQFKGSLVAKK